MLKANLKKEILKILREANESKPVYSHEIESQLALQGATVRDLIRELRRSGHPITGSSKGYYYSRSREQTMDIIDSLEGRAKSMLHTASMLRKRYRIPVKQSKNINSNFQFGLFRGEPEANL